MSREKRPVLVYTNGKMAQCTQASGKTTNSMAWAFSAGAMDACTLATSTAEICMAMASIITTMGQSTADSSLPIKKVALANIPGRMRAVMKATGFRASNMAWEFIQTLTIKK